MKNWLENNKIYFETAAAVFLSLMAIVVAWRQMSASLEQNEILKGQSRIMTTQEKYSKTQLDLTNLQLELTKQQYLNEKNYENMQLQQSTKQLDIADKQLKVSLIQQNNAEREDHIQKKADFLLIQDALMTVLDRSTFIKKQFKDMTKEEITDYYDFMIDTMTINRNNQILLRNEQSMKDWRKAAGYFQLCRDILTYKTEHILMPDESDPLDITKYKDTPELRLKFANETHHKAKDMIWKLKDKLLRHSEDSKQYSIYKNE